MQDHSLVSKMVGKAMPQVKLVLEGCADPNRCGPNQVSPPTREAKQVKRKKEEDSTEILCSPPEVNNRPKATHSHSSKSCCCVVTAW